MKIKKRIIKSSAIFLILTFGVLTIKILIWDSQDNRWILADIFYQPEVTAKLTIAPPIEQTTTGKIEIDDASKLNRTQVNKIFQPSSVKEIISIIQSAKTQHQKISLSGARHSMGGQIVYPNSFHLSMSKFDRINYNPDQTVTVESGATWKQIQIELGKHGRAVRVMQDSNIFSLGGSMSVNAHGKDTRYGSLIESVNYFKLITASGVEIKCSPTENADLFRSVIGGMGLFGVITEVNLKTTENTVYDYTVIHKPSREMISFMEKQIERPTLEMIEAQMSVDRSNFLGEAQIYYFDRAHPNAALKDDVTGENSIWLRKLVYRTSRNSDWGKQFRWFMQKNIGPYLDPKQLTRNSGMAAPFRTLELNQPDTTDILQEYFVPVDQANNFLDKYVNLLNEHNMHLINVTVRKLNQDRTALVSYATSNMYAFVSYYRVARDRSDSEQLSKFTQKMMDILDQMHGTFYLAYKGYYTKEQLYRMYPKITMLFSLKKQYDPQEIFSNSWYEEFK